MNITTHAMTLKPCPFCASGALVSGIRKYWVMCQGCNCLLGDYDTPEKAASNWNRRRPELVPMDSLDIEELFDAAADADEEVHHRFARMIEKHHCIPTPKEYEAALAALAPDYTERGR